MSEFEKSVRNICLYWEGYKLVDDILAAHNLAIERTKLDVLDLIADGEGWEESRDAYAIKLGLPTKYNFEANKPKPSDEYTMPEIEAGKAIIDKFLSDTIGLK